MRVYAGGVLECEIRCHESAAVDADGGGVVGGDAGRLLADAERVGYHRLAHAVAEENQIRLLEWDPNEFLVDPLGDVDDKGIGTGVRSGGDSGLDGLVVTLGRFADSDAGF